VGIAGIRLKIDVMITLDNTTELTEHRLANLPRRADNKASSRRKGTIMWQIKELSYSIGSIGAIMGIVYLGLWIFGR
jgi:hypothetical protein